MWLDGQAGINFPKLQKNRIFCTFYRFALAPLVSVLFSASWTVQSTGRPTHRSPNTITYMRGRGQRLDRRVSTNRDTETFTTVVSVSSIVDTLRMRHVCLCVRIPRECVSFGLDFHVTTYKIDIGQGKKCRSQTLKIQGTTAFCSGTSANCRSAAVYFEP